MRLQIALPCLLGAAFFAITALAQTPTREIAAAGPPLEIVKQSVDIDVASNGSYLMSSDTAYRILSQQGIEALKQMTLSYTEDYQLINIVRAYTQKANGTRINVPPGQILVGNGDNSQPGFQDLKRLTIIFQNLEIGDQVVIATVFQQKIPWYDKQFATEFAFFRSLQQHNVKISISAPTADIPIYIDAAGLEGGQPETVGKKTRWTWQYHNDVVIPLEEDSVAETDNGPHLFLSSFPDYRSVAQAYADHSRDKAEVTSDIRSLANKVTSGIRDKRTQARALYDWVTNNVSYVEILLGAGGFTPHKATDVLANRYGDCKDHTVLFEALLAAKGIQSEPALINAGNSYRLSDVASPFFFDHVINYLPELDLYLDTTSRFTPFGVLPPSDMGKSVVLVKTGIRAQTPVVRADETKITTLMNVKVKEDGTAEGTSQITATGYLNAQLRSLFSSITPDTEAEYFRQNIGPGAEGKLALPDLKKLDDTFAFNARYTIPNYMNPNGAGALPISPGYNPFSFTFALAGSLPPKRTDSYVCLSLTAEEQVHVDLPQGRSIIALPDPVTMEVSGIKLQIHHERISDTSFKYDLQLHLDYPEPTCTPQFYTAVRADLTKMMGALRAQVLYK